MAEGFVSGSGIQMVLRSPAGMVGTHLAARAKLVEAAARALAPKRTGALVDSIEASIPAVPYGRGLEVRVGSRLPYAAFVHEGTRPHVIEPRERTVLRWPGAGGDVFAQRVNHPGTKPMRFLTDALRAAI